MNGWQAPPGALRAEAHFGDRIVQCRSERPGSLIAMLRQGAELNPDGEALVCGDFRATWTELMGLIDGFASTLAALGLGRGDRIILFVGNRAEFVIALGAIARIGAIGVPVGIREQAPGLAFIAEQSGARAIIHDSDLVDRIPPLPIVVAVPDGDPRAFAAGAGGAALPDAAADGGVPALIMYTSGTTGRPKGAILSHIGLIHTGFTYVECMRLGSDDRSVCAIPLSHISGVTAAICPMALVGGAIVVMPHFGAPEFATLAAAERITQTLMVPAMYNLLVARVDLAAFDLARWRIGAFGGAPMPEATIARMAQALPTLALMNCYGATETSGGITVMPPEALDGHGDSVGLAVPGASLLVMDEDGREVPPGEAGELWIGGPSVIPGYWGNPEATKAAIVGGHWRSGDLGSIDSDGFVRVLDRLKDMINRGGYKIFSAEVESVLAAHPAVLEAAVVGKPCPILGERVHGFVTLREEHVAETELKQWCAERLSDYKRPEAYTILDAPLPRNLAGKVLKTELRKLAVGLQTERRAI